LAQKCFDVTATIVSSGDTMTVLHCTDESKTYLPAKQQPASIKLKYDTDMMTKLPAGKHRMVLEPKNGQETKEAVCNWVNAQKGLSTIHIMAVGQVGRKGPKEDPTILGSCSDQSMRCTTCATMVVKDKSTVPASNKKHFVCCVDGSPPSKVLHDDIARALAKDGDKITLLHVKAEASTNVQALEDTYKNVANGNASKPTQVFSVIDAVANEPTGETICNWIENQKEDVDFLLIGADGMRAFAEEKHFIGSNSEFLVKNAKCTVIIGEVRNYY